MGGLPMMSRLVAVIAVFGVLHADDPAEAKRLPPPVAGARPTVTAVKLTAHFHVGATAGIGLGADNWGDRGKVSIIAFPAEPAANGDELGFVVRIVNRSGASVRFNACDLSAR